MKCVPIFVSMLFPLYAQASVPRPMSAAGAFYPSVPEALQKTLDDLIKKANKEKPEVREGIFGLIVPHAGYTYSGPVSSRAYKQIRGKPFDVVIILGPAHNYPLPNGVSVWSSGDWETPLGRVMIDDSFAELIKMQHTAFQKSETAHLNEHAIEVQLPFLQDASIVPKAKIVPIAINDVALARPLAQALHQIYEQRRRENKKFSILIVASTDMSHYIPKDDAMRIDEKTAELIQKGDAQALTKELEDNNNLLCGGAAVVTLLEFARLAAAINRIAVLQYGTSADAPGGDPKKVVGYSSALVGGIHSLQRKDLLSMARQSIRKAVAGGDEITPFIIDDPQFQEKKNVFVTIRDAKGQLRGCVGSTGEPESSLLDAVNKSAAAAATKDDRFPPIRRDELDSMDLEISILSSVFPITPENFVFGVQGAVIDGGTGHVGVYLPEVARHFKTKEDFLQNLCVEKAKLPESCWKTPGILSAFRTQSVREKDEKEK